MTQREDEGKNGVKMTTKTTTVRTHNIPKWNSIRTQIDKTQERLGFLKAVAKSGETMVFVKNAHKHMDPMEHIHTSLDECRHCGRDMSRYVPTYAEIGLKIDASAIVGKGIGELETRIATLQDGLAALEEG